MFKVNNKNTGKRFEICSNITIKTPEQRRLCYNCCLWTYFILFSSVSTFDFEQVNDSWESIKHNAEKQAGEWEL